MWLSTELLLAEQNLLSVDTWFGVSSNLSSQIYVLFFAHKIRLMKFQDGPAINKHNLASSDLALIIACLQFTPAQCVFAYDYACGVFLRTAVTIDRQQLQDMVRFLRVNSVSFAIYEITVS